MKKILGAVLLLAIGFNAKAQPCTLPGSLSTGVLAFYPFGGGSLLDASGSGNNLMNPTTAYPVMDRFGSPTCAYHFDEINGDYLIIPASGTTFLNGITTSAFSISLWYQPTGVRPGGAYELLLGRGSAPLHCPDTWGEWSVGLYDCRKAVVGFDQYSHWQASGGYPTCNAEMAAISNVWHHLAFVYDGIGTYSLYIDGALTTTSSGPCGPMSANIGPMILGEDYTGDLDDIVIYNRMLTAAEVSTLQTLPGFCCGGVTPPPVKCTSLTGSLSTGVLAFYPFGNGSLLDLTFSGYNLTNPTTAYPTVDRSGNPTCAYHFDKAFGDFLVRGASGTSFLNGITTGAFSISLWYQPQNMRPVGDYELLIGRGNAPLHCPDTWGEWSVGLYDCRKAVVGFDQYSHWQSTSLGCTAYMASIANSWHHLAFVYDGAGTYDLYIDGILSSSSSGPCGPMSANVGPMIIGEDFTGDIDDIVIYNRNITPAEVFALMALPGSCCDGVLSSAKTTSGASNTIAAQKGDLKIYPNPSDGRVSISAPASIVRTVTVYTSLGAVAGTYQFNASEVSINLDHLAPGIYSVKVVTDAGTTIEKVTKN